MELSIQNYCNVCREILTGSGIITRATDITEILTFLLVNVNYALLYQSIICETCLSKVQWAYKFKILYSEGSQKTLDIVTVKEEMSLENDIICGMCKKTLDSSDSISFVDFEPNRSTLIKHFPVQFASKVFDNLRTCKKCHKSLLNFCTIMNAISIFEQNSAVISEMNMEERKNFQQSIDLDNSNSSFKFNVKQEYLFQDVKEEMDSTLQDVKEEREDDSTYQEFILKNEEVDLKCDVDSEDETECKLKIQNLKMSNLPTPGLNGTKKHPLLKSSLINEKAEMFQCEICKYQTKRKNNLKKHMLVHKSANEIQMYECSVCSFQTKHKGASQRHMLIHKKFSEIEMFRCNLCEYQSKRKGDLKVHTLKHKIVNKIETFQCKVCDYQSDRRSNLARHMLIHKKVCETKLFQCRLCEYQTNYKNDLNKHKLIHEKCDASKIFQCLICKYRTRFKHTLTRHMLIHKNDKETEMFQCEICDFQSKHKYYLKKHLLIHEQTDKFQMIQCSCCKFQTRYKKYLKMHMLIHINDESEKKRFKCHVCNFQTKYLQQHMLIHKNVNNIAMTNVALNQIEEIPSTSRPS